MFSTPRVLAGITIAVVSLLFFGFKAHAQCATEQIVLGSDSEAGDRLGFAVAIDGDVAVAGAPFEGLGPVETGAAYAYRFNGTSWVQEQKLVATVPVDESRYGRSCAVDGDVIVVGSPQSNADPTGGETGAAYVFRFNGTVWVQEAILTASDGEQADLFGWSVSVSGDVVVAGAWGQDLPVLNGGAAYVFRYDGLTWEEEAKLSASDLNSNDQFGSAVAVSGDVAVVGACLHDDGGTRGAAYVYRFDGFMWNEEQELYEAAAAAQARFGCAVAVDGTAIIVGAERDNNNDSGSAYIYRHDGIDWVLEADLTASDAAADDEFGKSVSIEGDIAVVGANLDDDGGDRTGSAYVYRLTNGTWTEALKLTAGDPAPVDQLGFSVGYSDGVAIAGAVGGDDGGSDSGVAHLYELELPVITLQPTSVAICASTLLTLNVIVDGPAPLDYQWSRDGIDLPSQTTDTLVIPSAAVSDSGVYRCVITTACGTLESDEAVVLVETCFVRGDANQDGGVDIANVSATLGVLFAGDTVTCDNALDANDDDVLDLSDPVSLLDFLFNGGSAPAAPYPACGEEPFAGPIGCDSFVCP